MKLQYENRTRYSLPRRSYTILRLDGRAFHTFTRGLAKPFDHRFIEAMSYTATGLCEQIQGTKFAYVQSDEISLLLTDFETPQTEAWFDGNIQKMCSIAASIGTVEFNRAWEGDRLAHFDARVFTIPDEIEVENYFIWRQKDWARNSLQMLARANFSHKELHEKGQADMHEMLHTKGINWADCSEREKNGTLILKDITGTWNVFPAFVFAGESRAQLTKLIPKRWAEISGDVNDG